MPEQPEVKTVTISTNAGIPEGTTLHTPAGMPNLVVKTKHPAVRIATRIARVYVNTLVGMLAVVMGNLAPGTVTPPQDFMDKLLVAAGIALAPAIITLLTNLAELLAKLDSQA